MKILVISDIHFPFEDKKTLRLVSRFIEDYQPDNIVINGDLLDCYDVSSFPKDPRNKKTLVQEIKLGKKYMEHLNSISKAKKYLVFGNHSLRVNKYLISKASEIIDLVNLKSLLETKHWKIIDTSNVENYIKIGKFFIGHFDRVNKHAGMTAKNLVLDKGVNIIQGHTHRLGAFYLRTMNGTLKGFETGCLCKLNPTYTGFPNWQQGFVIIENNNVYQIEIENHSFTYNSKIYK